MKCNVGSADRIVRVVLGLALLALALFVIAGGAWKWILIVIGAISLVTGLASRCPAYMLFKINTCKAEQASPATHITNGRRAR